MFTISRDQWTAVRVSLRDAADRFARLVASLRDPAVKATVHWSAAETAAHVAATARLYTVLLGPGDTSGVLARTAGTTVDNIGELNEEMLRELTEREPGAIAELVRGDVDRILSLSEGLDPESPVAWLGQAKVPLAGALAHLQNELLIHGRDIAFGAGRPWPIAAADAALFFDLFIVGVIRYDVGGFLDNDEPPKERRIAAEFRSAYTTPVTIVLHRGQLSVEEPGGPTDIRLRFDPPALNLMLFHRVSHLRTVLSGGVSLRGGRRPWLLFEFLRTVRAP